jgi:lipopolysaccharide/colanic/teichoic acid biosynthesis glycosyltransferase
MSKRLFDIFLAGLGVVLLAPLLGAIAILVALDSRGPMLYRGIRTGRYGRPFRILKFRTMVPDAEKVGGGTTALGDRRITRVGHVLRRYKLDELPQLFNVLKGDMSLVGPRPELPRYTDRYRGEERLILSVRPGITDFSSIRFASLDEMVGAQDADRVFETAVLPQKNQLRVRYVKEASFFVDVKILFLTAAKIIEKVLGSGRRHGET